MVEKNSAELWDDLWTEEFSKEHYDYELLAEEKSIRWQRIEKKVLNEFKSFNNLNVIEIGSGTGKCAALMAKRGANVTLLDYSDLALKSGKKLFGINKLKVNLVKCDALTLPPELLDRYDISVSLGLAEHFLGDKRKQIIKSHFDVLKKGGLSFISVPNKWNIPYICWKFLLQVTGKWVVGEEYPFSRRELKRLCREIGVKDYLFFGESLKFYNPIKILGYIFKLKKPDISLIKTENGTMLDQYISGLILCGKKN